jgi:hypothetical protein
MQTEFMPLYMCLHLYTVQEFRPILDYKWNWHKVAWMHFDFGIGGTKLLAFVFDVLRLLSSVIHACSSSTALLYCVTSL